MRALIRALMLSPAFALCACGGGGSHSTSDALASTAGHSREFVLGHGETGEWGSLALEFTSVIDERCGMGSAAVCVWEGNAQVFVTATQDQTTQILTLNTSPRYTQTALFAGRTIELRQLDPQPTYQDTGRPSIEDYTATLFVGDAP